MLDVNSLTMPSGEPLLNSLLLGIAFLALCIASVTDLKTREVPDFLNYGLVFFGLALNIMLSIFYADYRYALDSVIGFGLCYGIGWLMFYAGQWGGGDSKMLMGLGALFGIPFAWKNSFMLSFLLNILLAGAMYGILWVIWLAISQRRRYGKEFRKLTATPHHRALRFVCLGLLIGVLALLPIDFATYTIKLTVLWLLLFPALLYYVWLLIKCVEKSSMLTLLPVTKLTEGDWIAKDVYVKGKYVCGPKDLGISKKQLKLLKQYGQKKLIKKILVKQGIPFIPSFLLALFFTLLWGNPFIAALVILG
jgi:Flp pilus assembly protein protease CpaA